MVSNVSIAELKTLVAFPPDLILGRTFLFQRHRPLVGLQLSDKKELPQIIIT